MEVLCSLCKKPLEVRKTKKGGYWTLCPDCDSRSFISKPAGMALVEAQAKALSESSEEEAFEELAEQEAAEAAPANPGNPGPSSDAAIVGELKTLGKRVKTLEENAPEASVGDDEDPKDIGTCSSCGARFNRAVRGLTKPGLLSEGGLLICPVCHVTLEPEEEPVENPGSDEEPEQIDWDS